MTQTARNIASRTVNSNSRVDLIAFAHYYNEGARGARGGAASNDKVWGVARIDGKLVNFWGRRGGVLKFKTFFAAEEGKVMQKYAEKTGDRRDGGDIYTAVKPTSPLVNVLVPDLHTKISSYFYKGLRAGTVNTNH